MKKVSWHVANGARTTMKKLAVFMTLLAPFVSYAETRASNEISDLTSASDADKPLLPQTDESMFLPVNEPVSEEQSEHAFKEASFNFSVAPQAQMIVALPAFAQSPLFALLDGMVPSVGLSGSYTDGLPGLCSTPITLQGAGALTPKGLTLSTLFFRFGTSRWNSSIGQQNSLLKRPAALISEGAQGSSGHLDGVGIDNGVTAQGLYRCSPNFKIGGQLSKQIKAADATALSVGMGAGALMAFEHGKNTKAIGGGHYYLPTTAPTSWQDSDQRALVVFGLKLPLGPVAFSAVGSFGYQTAQFDYEGVGTTGSAEKKRLLSTYDRRIRVLVHYPRTKVHHFSGGVSFRHNTFDQLDATQAKLKEHQAVLKDGMLTELFAHFNWHYHHSPRYKVTFGLKYDFLDSFDLPYCSEKSISGAARQALKLGGASTDAKGYFDRLGIRIVLQFNLPKVTVKQQGQLTAPEAL